MIDSVGSSLAKSIDIAALRGHVLICGQTGGTTPPILPHVLRKKSVSLPGGYLPNLIAKP